MPKKEYDMYNNKLPFKLIIKINLDRQITQVMERPKLGEINPAVHVSGLHMFPKKPEENHYDHYKNGKKWKERSSKKKKLSFPIEVHEDYVLI